MPGVKRGTEFIDRVPMNWGKNLNLLGAIRRDGWVVLTTTYAKATKDNFVWRVKTKLLNDIAQIVVGARHTCVRHI